MEANILTVDSLIKYLNIISEKGYGDMKIKCNDVYLHDTEISTAPYRNELILRGYIFNQPMCEKVKRLKEDIEQATERFYK